MPLQKEKLFLFYIWNFHKESIIKPGFKIFPLMNSLTLFCILPPTCAMLFLQAKHPEHLNSLNFTAYGISNPQNFHLLEWQMGGGHTSLNNILKECLRFSKKSSLIIFLNLDSCLTILRVMLVHIDHRNIQVYLLLNRILPCSKIYFPGPEPIRNVQLKEENLLVLEI